MTLTGLHWIITIVDVVGVYKPGIKSESLESNVEKTQDKSDRVIIRFCGLPSAMRISLKSAKNHLGFW